MSRQVIKVKKINDQKIVPIDVPKPKGLIKGQDIIHELYSNIFLCAVKRSGKTNVLFHILKACVTRKTKIIAFVGSFYNDDNWKLIRKYFEEKKNPIEGHISLIDDNGVDQLQLLVIKNGSKRT